MENLAEIDGSIDDKTYKIYDELAKGGVGAIITGFTSVLSNDFYFGGMMRLSEDFFIQQYKKLTEIVHAENCKIISQLALGAFYKNSVEIHENNLSKVEILRGIKNSTNLHVTIKINCSDFVDGGNDFEKSFEICKILAEN